MAVSTTCALDPDRKIPQSAICESQFEGSSVFPFLACAPEVRNQVYDILFDHSDPITIQPYWAQKEPAVIVPRSLSVPGIGLLSTCRQVDKEATRILYQRNRFFFAAAHYKRSMAVHIDLVECWLTCIGRNRMLVRNVLIEFQIHARENLDITPIVREMRRHPTINPDMSFVPLGNGPIPRKRLISEGRPIMFYDYEVTDPTPFNRVIDILKAKEPSPMGTLARLVKTMRYIRCDRDGSRIDFVFDRTGECLSFHWCNNGDFKHLVRYPARRKCLYWLLRYSTIPWASLYYVIVPEYKKIFFDLDRKTMTPLLPKVMKLNTELRSMVYDRLKRARLIVKLQPRSLTGLSESLPMLKSWAADGWLGRFRHSDDQILMPKGTYGGIEIALEYIDRCPSTLEQIRFDAVEFIWATLCIPSTTLLSVRLICADDPDCQKNDRRWHDLMSRWDSLNRMQNRLHKFLIQLVHDNPARASDRCPSISLNGYLQLSEANFNTLSTNPACATIVHPAPQRPPRDDGNSSSTTLDSPHHTCITDRKTAESETLGGRISALTKILDGRRYV